MSKPRKKAPPPSFVQVLIEMDSLKLNSRVVTLVAHGFIELMVNALVEAHCKNHQKISSNRRDYPHATKLLVLHELGILSDDRYRELDRFRDVRNRAAHDAVFRISADELSFVELPSAIAELGANDRSSTGRAARFYNACMILIGKFWNEHIPTFNAAFPDSRTPIP